MGNPLLQRGLLLYILTLESCDSYMIFYNNYVLNGCCQGSGLLVWNEAVIDTVNGWC